VEEVRPEGCQEQPLPKVISYFSESDIAFVYMLLLCVYLILCGAPIKRGKALALGSSFLFFVDCLFSQN
jgi:hypothetical protein